MKSKIIYTFLLILLSINTIASQNITQTIKGKIIDIITGEPLIGATVVINNSNPIIGTTTDIEGNYTLEDVEVGRHTLSVSYIGYKTIITEEILLTSSKPFLLDVELDEDFLGLDAVVITTKKRDLANRMAVVSSRSFTIEESSRLAGGLSDPSRVAYNFAGVTFSAPQDNGVVIRGNAPSSVLWRLNGMDVSGAAHFGGGNLAGAGLISIYSANILKRSKFFTGAFPAEYAGGTSGVFDIEFRKGNKDEAKHLLQLGILGVDISSEGPLNKSNGSSYLINYRHGFIGYYGALAGGTEPYYQDLSFNLNFPTKKYGEFSLWGIGGLSRNVVPVGEYKNEFDEDEGTYDIKYREYEGWSC